MIPSNNKILTADLTVTTQPSNQYKLDFDKHQIIGKCDGLEAVRQSIFKILNTERYTQLIYSWNYGIELADLYGEPFMIVCPELERRIKEALLQDDRITAVDGFEFDTSKKGVITVTFTVHTLFGDVAEEMAVNA